MIFADDANDLQSVCLIDPLTMAAIMLLSSWLRFSMILAHRLPSWWNWIRIASSQFIARYLFMYCAAPNNNSRWVPECKEGHYLFLLQAECPGRSLTAPRNASSNIFCRQKRSIWYLMLKDKYRISARSSKIILLQIQSPVTDNRYISFRILDFPIILWIVLNDGKYLYIHTRGTAPLSV